MKIKEIKIINQDESTEIADIGANAENVDYNDTTVKAELDKLNTVDDSIMNIQANQGTTLNNLELAVSNLASGSPKGAYVSATALKTANPNTGVYVVTGNGHIYSWTKNQSEDPVDLGIYQATEIANGSVTAEKTNFVDVKHMNHFKVAENLANWHGLIFDKDIDEGKIEINGTCTENTNFKIGNDLDYFFDVGNYVFDLNVLSGTLSAGIGVSIFGKNENDETITLLNVGSATLPATINITQKIKITAINLWIVSGRTFANYLIYPQLQKNSISQPLPHNLYKLKNSYLDIVFNDKIQNFLDNKNKTELLVPSHIRFLPNRDLSLYYDNILYNSTEKEIYNHQSYNNFTHLDNCFRFNKPNSNNYYERLIFNKNDINHTKVFKDITFFGVDTNAGNGVTKKCLFIGDSLTNKGYYTQELLDMFEDDVMNIELLGTRGTGLNKHEGRNNWSAYSYTHESTYAGLSNPFWNSNSNSFDFTKYMNDNNYSTIDIVSIGLGTNDRGVIGSTEDEFKTNLQTMINSIKTFNSNIKIMILLPPPVCSVGYDYVSWNMSIKLANKTIIDHFDNKQNQNIYIVATGLNIDPINDYIMKTIPINDRSSITKTVVDDPIHPDVIGFKHIADVIYPMLKYLGSL